MEAVRRVVVLGRGGAGKSVFARRLGALTGLPVVELDGEFWQSGLRPLPPDGWAAAQERLAAADAWIMDGDLGPYDVLDVRLRRADTVVLLDFSLPRCAWRAVRRGRERADFWRWVWSYRRRYRPAVLAAVAEAAPHAALHVLRGPRAVERFLSGTGEGERPTVRQTPRMPWRYEFRPETVSVRTDIQQRVVAAAASGQVAAVRLLREETGLPLTVSVQLVRSWTRSGDVTP